MKYYAVAVLAGLGLALSSHAQPIAVPPVPVATTPAGDDAAVYLAGKWTYPDMDVMASAYPNEALVARVGGRVALDCEVAPTGKITSCDLMSEEPPGYGFGEATAMAFIGHAHVDPASIPGGIPAGARKKFVYVWSL